MFQTELEEQLAFGASPKFAIITQDRLIIIITIVGPNSLVPPYPAHPLRELYKGVDVYCYVSDILNVKHRQWNLGIRLTNHQDPNGHTPLGSPSLPNKPSSNTMSQNFETNHRQLNDQTCPARQWPHTYVPDMGSWV